MRPYQVVGWTIVIHFCSACLSNFSGRSNSCKTLQHDLSLHGVKRRDHITPVLSQLYWQLHWLTVHQRVEFKIACLVYQSLSGQTSVYLADDIKLVDERGRQNLRSVSERKPSARPNKFSHPAVYWYTTASLLTITKDSRLRILVPNNVPL